MLCSGIMRRKELCLAVSLVTVLVLNACKDSKKIKENRLSNAASPYLREHADNPVDWYPWGDEALNKAKAEDKPLLISIGYASCHWCHVMERESFMDTAVARIMNERFVPIKVDREERPDIDNIYMHACQLLNNGEAGWPLNAFALPDGKPFYAGTYYSKERWIKLLTQISDNYRLHKNKVELQASALTFGMVDNDSLLLHIEPQATHSNVSKYHSAFEKTYQQIDIVNGGWIGNPKFPNPASWEFFLQYYYFTQDKKALSGTITTLGKMASGAMYDQIGGGFSRYATDSLWRLPHFEKMLCDNAQLVSLYAHAYQLTRNEEFKRIAEETIGYIEAELSAPGGGFYSSMNAESVDGEGDYYAWSVAQINAVLGVETGKIISQFFNSTENGNWKTGKNLLYLTHNPASFAQQHHMTEEQFLKLLKESKVKMAAKRNERPKPAVDTKILTSWNALLISAYADAYTAFQSDVFLEKANSLAKFIAKNMLSENGQLWRLQSRGNLSVDAFLDDYAFLAKAYIRLYEVSFDTHWVMLAEKLIAYALKNFYDQPKGIFYFTSRSSDNLAFRKVELLSSVLPSPNAVMGENLIKLSTLLDKNEYAEISQRLLTRRLDNLEEIVPYSSQWGSLAGLNSYGYNEVVIMGKDARNLNRQLQQHYLPACTFMGGTEENLPLLENKIPAVGTLIYVCSNKTCKMPVAEVARALEQLKKLKR